MDADTLRAATEYEQLTARVYQALLNSEGHDTIEVRHNEDVAGKSGVAHQIDVLWRYRVAGVENCVLVECKNYSSALTLEKVRNFYAVCHDIGNCNGVMVTRVGYQSGAAKFANYYGIKLKLVRPPTESDWEGRVRTIHINTTAKGPVSTEECPIQIEANVKASDEAERLRLADMGKRGRLKIAIGADTVFVDKDRIPITERSGLWLPKQLDVIGREPGGPYEQRIPLEGHYLLLNEGDEDEVLVNVAGLVVTFHVEVLDVRETIIHGDSVVEAILKDFGSGDVEHVMRRD